MKKKLRIISMGFMAMLLIAGCKNDDDQVPNPSNPNEAELITTVKLLFTERISSAETEAIFKDADGDGGALPTIFDTIRLEQGKVYDVAILLLDESKNPTDTISHEVEEEGDEHQFFFTASGGASVSFVYSDADINNVPIGLLSEWTTGTATTDKNGKVQVVLKHQGEDKPDSGSGNSSIGDTDIQINFPIIIN